jgi:hypothetical protein
LPGNLINLFVVLFFFKLFLSVRPWNAPPPFDSVLQTLDVAYKSRRFNVHSVQLGGSTLGDLLNTELTEFGLQLIELLGEIILALSPELVGLDLGARLNCREKSNNQYSSLWLY